MKILCHFVPPKSNEQKIYESRLFKVVQDGRDVYLTPDVQPLDNIREFLQFSNAEVTILKVLKTRRRLI